MHIPNKDLLIIQHLRTDSRQSLTRMSRKTGIPISTIFDKIKTYNGKIIQKNTCLIDFYSLGYQSRANVIIKVNRDSKDRIKGFLLAHPNVNSLYKVNNGYDFMFELVFKDIKQLENFMEDVEHKYNVSDKRIFYIIDDIKREEFLVQ